MDIDKNNEAYYLIRGGTPLYGEIPLSGAKNANTKMIIASLLTGEPCLLRNVPLIGEADIPKPGGDRIGARPIDFHLNGLRLMGAEIVERDRGYHFTAPHGLRGANIQLPFPSVMATENFLISASLA